MQRCTGNRGSRKAHWGQIGGRGQHAGASDLNRDPDKTGLFLFRRKLIGNRPFGCIDPLPQQCTGRKIVNFDHHTVNIIRKPIPQCTDLFDLRNHLLIGRRKDALPDYREAERRKTIQCFGMGNEGMSVRIQISRLQVENEKIQPA